MNKNLAAEIQGAQKRIAELKELKANEVKEWIDANIFSLDDSAREALKDTGVAIDEKLDDMLKRAKKLHGPRGFLRHFITQSQDDILKLTELMVDVRAHLALSLDKMESKYDAEVKTLREKMRKLATEAENERLAAQRAASLEAERIRNIKLKSVPQKPAPTGYNPRRAPPPPAYHPRSTTTRTTTTVSTTNNDTSDGSSGFLTGMLIDEMLSNNSSPTVVDVQPTFQSGQGGDFGGGGASGSWSSSDDLGASNFS